MTGAGHDLAGTDPHLARAAGGKRRVMGDQNQRHIALGLLGKDQVGNLLAGFGIEIAGRFVGDQKFWRWRQRPGNGDALLFAAGQLAGIMRQPLAKSDGDQLLPGDFEGVANIGKLQRHGDVFQRRHIGDQMKGLEDDADIAATEFRNPVFAQAVQWRAVDNDLAAVEALQPGQNHQKRGLSGPGRTDDPDGLACIDRQIHSLENMNGRSSLAEGQIRIFQVDHGFCQGKLSYMYNMKVAGTADFYRFKGTFMRIKGFCTFLLAITAIVIMPAVSRAEPLSLVGFGDSLMAGYQLPAEDAFPARLEKALREKGHDVTISNAGVSGDTTSGGLARIDWSVPDGTKGVILELGANDALRGIAPEESRKNLVAMIEKLKSRGIAVLLVGMMAPPNMGADYAARFNPVYPELAKTYGLELYPFFLDGVVEDAKLKIEDGMHPNGDGIGVMVERFLPSAERFLQSLATGG
jgi:acyl-CoA thioesterase-1